MYIPISTVNKNYAEVTTPDTMTKACILTSSHATFDSRIFHKQARTLAEEGYDVMLVTPHGADTKRHGVKVKAVGGGDVSSAGLGDAFDVYRTAKSTNADIYHFHDPGLLPFGVLLSFTTDAKIVYDCHEQYEKSLRRYDFPPDVLNPLVGAYPALQSLACRRFNAVVTTTEGAAEDFRRRGHSNIMPVRNFPVTDTIRIGRAPIKRTTERLLVYVGGFDPTRGPRKMLELISGLREMDIDVGAWLIGPLGHHEDELQRTADKKSVSRYVRFVGRVPHEQIFSYLNEADVGLALLDPERFEQDIPLKLFEYMYAGLPVVTTPIGASERFIHEEWGIIVPFEDAEIQATEVAELLADPRRIERMGREGRQVVEEEYSWKSEKTKLLDLYDDLSSRL